MLFKRNITKNGGSLCINIPKDVVEYLRLEDETPIIIKIDEKIISLWRDDDDHKLL